MARGDRTRGRRGAAGGIEAPGPLCDALNGLAAAVICGVGHHRLLHSAERTEVLVLSMLTERVSERQAASEEERINRMANEIAKRFS